MLYKSRNNGHNVPHNYIPDFQGLEDNFATRLARMT